VAEEEALGSQKCGYKLKLIMNPLLLYVFLVIGGIILFYIVIPTLLAVVLFLVLRRILKRNYIKHYNTIASVLVLLLFSVILIIYLISDISAGLSNIKSVFMVLLSIFF